MSDQWRRRPRGGRGNVVFLSQDTASRLRHGQVADGCRALDKEAHQRVALARERAADHLVDGDRGQLGRRHLELKRRPRIRRSREEAVEEVEVLQDDGVREP